MICVHYVAMIIFFAQSVQHAIQLCGNGSCMRHAYPFLYEWIQFIYHSYSMVASDMAIITTEPKTTNQSRLSRSVQALMQTVEDEMAASLGLLNRHIDGMFGKLNSLYIATTPRALLFEGIQFCSNTKGLAEIMCQILRDRQLNTMQVMSDGSVQFALFKYVRIRVCVLTCDYDQTSAAFCAEKRNARRTLHRSFGIQRCHSGGRRQGLA